MSSDASPALQANRGTPHRIRGLGHVVDVAMLHGWICVAQSKGFGGCFRADPHSDTRPPLPTELAIVQLAVEAGSLDQMCARMVDGTVICGPTGERKVAGATELSCRVGCCAVTRRGLVCFGNNRDLGFGHDPTLVPDTADIVDVTVAFQSMVGITKAGGARWWGHRAPVAVAVDGPIRAVVDLDAIACAVGADDKVSCGSRIVPHQLPGIVDARGSCAVLADGSVRCWGENSRGELGDGKPVLAATPVKVPGLDRVVDLRISMSAACALRDDGTTKCWGRSAKSTPPAVALAHAVDPHCVLISESQVSCSTGSFSRSVTLDGGATVKSMAVDINGKVCSIDRAGAVVCAEHASAPWQKLRTRGVAEEVLPLSSGFCVRFGDGHVECLPSKYIARDHEHVLGAPARVPQIGDAVQLATSSWESCVRRKTGAVACWRADSDTQPVPTDIPAVVGATWIAGGRDMSFCAIVAGKIWCWGRTDDGVLGNGTVPPIKKGTMYTEIAIAPIPATHDFVATRIALGDSAHCAIDDKAQVWCWGSDRNGLLGQGRVLRSQVPVRVVGLGP